MIQSHLILFTLLPIFWHFFIHPVRYPFSFFHFHVSFPCCFSFTRRISSSVFLKRLRNNRRHTNCDQWKVSACPLRSKDLLHSIRTKQTSQRFYITCHNGRTILDISVMTITEDKMQKVDLGKWNSRPKRSERGPTSFSKHFGLSFEFWKFCINWVFGQFFPYVLSPLGCFPSTIPGVNGFCEDFKPGRRLKVGLVTWIHERKRRRSDGRLKMDMVPKPWRLLAWPLTILSAKYE